MEAKVMGGGAEALAVPASQDQADKLEHRKSFKAKREKNIELEKHSSEVFEQASKRHIVLEGSHTENTKDEAGNFKHPFLS